MGGVSIDAVDDDGRVIDAVGAVGSNNGGVDEVKVGAVEGANVGVADGVKDGAVVAIAGVVVEVVGVKVGAVDGVVMALCAAASLLARRINTSSNAWATREIHMALCAAASLLHTDCASCHTSRPPVHSPVCP